MRVDLRATREALGNSQARSASTSGVVKLTLRTGSYDWQFVPEVRRYLADAGSKSCH